MTLKQIQAEKNHNTDKSAESHTWNGRSYLDCYDEILPAVREMQGNVLEIGVLFGGSLRLWRDYFPAETKIIGIDIDPDRKHFELPERGVHVEIGSQADEAFLQEVIDKYGPFKFILDDGSHVLNHMMESADALWPAVVPGGIYAMEDMRISYGGVDGGWPGMEHNPKQEMGPNDRRPFDLWLLDIIKRMDHWKGNIRRIDIHPMIIAFTKI